MADDAQPRHARLSEALCEAVEFGGPKRIRIGPEALDELVGSADARVGYKFGFGGPMTFENVPMEVVPGLDGCLVEHPNERPYATGIRPLGGEVPEPPIVAW